MNDAQTRASFVPAIIQATLADRNVAVWYTLIFLAPWPTTVLDRRPRLSHQIVVATTPNSAPPSVDATRDIQPSLPKPVILLRIHRTASYTLKTCRRNYESALLRRPHYALHPDHPSVPFPVTAVNPRKRKTIQRSHSQKRLPTSEITGRTILRSKGQSWIYHWWRERKGASATGTALTCRIKWKWPVISREMTILCFSCVIIVPFCAWYNSNNACI